MIFFLCYFFLLAEKKVTKKETIEEFAYAVREHWAIENKLHWGIDVIFCEDSVIVEREEMLK